jgi:hypothetical protein
MFKPVKVKALEGYKLWIEYADGVKGEVNLSYLAGKGVFSLWNDYNAFQKVYIGESGEIAWSETVDLCPDALYLKITGKTPEEVFPKLKAEKMYA